MHGNIDWIRICEGAFFVGMALFFLFMRERLGESRGLFSRLPVPDAVSARLCRAAQRRRGAESLNTRAIGLVMGAIALAFAIVIFVTTVAFTTLYAVFAIAIASVTTIACMRFRRARARSVATLAVRDARRFAPAYLQIFVALLVLTPLLWFSLDPIGATLATLAGAIIMWLARQTATMPSALTGDDLEVELFVDTRLRTVAVTTLFAVALAPGYVFEAFTGTTSALLRGVVIVGFFGILVSNFALASVMRKGPSSAEIARWSHAAE